MYDYDVFYPIDEKETIHYAVVSYHRDKTRLNEKSKWIIDEASEIDCFVTSISNPDWVNENTCWGVKTIKEADQVKIDKLGTGTKGDNLFFAKFIDGSKDNKWHGYPADYMNNNQDRPSTNFLRSLFGNKFLTKPQVSKIKKGKKCSL